MRYNFALIILVSFSALAQPQVQKSKVQIIKLKPAVESNWSTSVDYTATTNMADERSNKLYEHKTDFELGYNLGKWAAGDTGVGLGSGLLVRADGNNLRKEESNLQWDDVSLKVNYVRKVFSDSKIYLEAAEDLPTGYESQTEGYKSTLELLGILTTPLFSDRLKLINVISGSAILNTYSESPNSLASNPDYAAIYKLKALLTVYGGLAVGTSASFKSVHFINGENKLRSSTSQFIQYSVGNWKLSLAYLMGNYDENDTYRFLYLDQDRRVFKLGVNFEI
ncbi:MAG: hypothetical protein H7061_06160 [Bdellovibrionaceae bacterium]|nr:hypothetical protein [Bdellovibrio sp.]